MPNLEPVSPLQPTHTDWTVNTLLALMNERDRRYMDRFVAADEAVKLAKQNTDATKNTVNITMLIAIVGLILTIADKFK